MAGASSSSRRVAWIAALVVRLLMGGFPTRQQCLGEAALTVASPSRPRHTALDQVSDHGRERERVALRGWSWREVGQLLAGEAPYSVYPTQPVIVVAATKKF